MNSLKLTEVVPFTQSSKLSFIRFKDETGELINSWNTQKGKTLPIAEDFVGKVTASIYPDGVYYMEIKDTINGKCKEVPILKGKVELKDVAPRSQSEKIKAPEKLPVLLAESETVSYREYMEVKLALMQAQMEVESLNELIDELQEEAELAENENQTSEITTFFKEVGMPLLDKYFDLEERKVASLEAAPKSSSFKTPVNMTKPAASQVKRAPQSYFKRPAANSSNNRFNSDVPTDQNGSESSGSENSQAPELSPEELELIESLKGYNEEQLIEFYTACENAGQGNEAYLLIEQFRPDMMYIFSQEEGQ